jgi:nicotinate-nucleotide adenylyltransferase
MQILFGGTFDPIHNGHLKLGLYISELFKQKVDFLPITGLPNYKAPPVATTAQRITMLELAISKYSDNFSIDYSEVNLTEYSPTIDTLRRMNQQFIQPRAFIIGGDSLISLDIWDEWQEIFKYTNFVVASRPKYDFSQMKKELASFTQNRFVHNIREFDETQNGQIFITEFEPINISSTQIRQAINSQQNVSQYLNADVHSYIIKNKIYN